MLTDNNQIFSDWFVIIHRHLTKVSSQIIQCIIFEQNQLSTIYGQTAQSIQTKKSSCINMHGSANLDYFNKCDVT